MNSSEKKFRNRWKNFFSTLFDAPVLFFFLCTAGLVSANYLIKDNKIITAILSAFMVLFGGITGALFRKRWEELTEKPHLVAKGRMAIRNLKLLLSNITYYESRLVIYIDRLKAHDPVDTRFVEYLEEIIDWCKSLQEVCLTSIENWEDIIPEASNLISMIGTFSELRATENNLKGQIEVLTDQLHETEKEKDKTFEDKEKLAEQLKVKEEELSKVTEQVQDLRRNIKSGVLAGIATSTTTVGTSATSTSLPFGTLYGTIAPTKCICQYCKKEFVTTLPFNALSSPICDECRRQGKGPVSALYYK